VQGAPQRLDVAATHRLTMAEIARLRSLLFAPASRPDVLVKLPRSNPDGVVVDLEDAVPADGKAAARPHANRIGAELAAANPTLAVYVRVNAIPTEWFAADIAEGCTPELAGIVVPKIERSEEVDMIADALRDADLGQLHVVAGVETALGVDAVREFLRPPIAACYFGAEDFVADMGGVRTASNVEVLYARSRVALAARIAGVLAIDQVVTAFGDDEGFLQDAAQGRSLGYGGKLCIHPAQVALANRAFSPSPEEIERARRLLAAYEAAAARGEAAIDFEGQMVDEPLARHARAVLAASET
jgi:citrate lyase subunit beta / citryl-CoA lyase